MSEVEHANTEAARIESGSATGADALSNETTQRALDILLGKTSNDAGTEEGTENSEGNAEKKGAGRPKGPPKTMAEAAERLGIKPEEFYALEVSIADGQEAEKFTVGALKDAMKERTDFKFQQLEWGENKAQQEGELLRSRNELVELMALMPREYIKPEVINKIREKHAATIKVENERTLNVIPEWKSETKREADQAEMRAHLSRAGFPENYLNNVIDHRTMRYIRENMLREQRINAALAMVKKVAPKGQAPSPRGSSMRSARAPANEQRGERGRAGESRQIEAVKNILGQNLKGTI